MTFKKKIIMAYYLNGSISCTNFILFLIKIRVNLLNDWGKHKLKKKTCKIFTYITILLYYYYYWEYMTGTSSLIFFLFNFFTLHFSIFTFLHIPMT